MEYTTVTVTIIFHRVPFQSSNMSIISLNVWKMQLEKDVHVFIPFYKRHTENMVSACGIARPIKRRVCVCVCEVLRQ